MTSTVHLSQTRIAREGRTYLQQFVGKSVEHTTYEGEKLIGTLEFAPDRPAYSTPLIIRFDDGGWAAADLKLKMVH